MATSNRKQPRSAGLKNKVRGVRDGSISMPSVEDGMLGTGVPLDLRLDLIDEDPMQPRTEENPGFSTASLAELAASISQRKVKTPISVRENPQVPGRFIVNHGARRVRASLLAGNATIPGFIDNDYNEADQVIENLQRNALTPREIADFIGRELAQGFKRNEIAKIISKSPAFVTQHANLLDLPDPIADAFNAGRAKDVTVVSELLTAFKRNAVEVADWLAADNQEITRSSVKLLRAFLDVKRQHVVNAEIANDAGTNEDEIVESQLAEQVTRRVDLSHHKRAVLQVLHDQRLARLLLTRRPARQGLAWLKYEDTAEEAEVNLAMVRPVALLYE
jgi:ParB family chromosome partitioning protein